ncbi:MAG: IS4 family transposase [Leptolyngbyaceae bacterium]|nr:IS4 family transposase [Leptolyngbyaceae bacterium]
MRHAKRLHKILSDLSEHPTESVPAATETASDSQSVYRFWSNPTVKAESILASHRDGVIRRSRAHEVVLAIQDTTDFSFATHPATEGLGFINQTKQQGIKVHSCFAVSGDGEPLGLLHQVHWSRAQRKGKKGERRRKPIEEKESYRWLSTLQAAEQDKPDSVQLIHVGDREADIFELFAQPRADKSDLLIRAEHNRKVQHELGYLIPTLEQAPVVGERTIELQRNPKRPAREAHLQVRAMQLTVEVPQHHPTSKPLSPLSLNAILVEEPSPPDGSTPIRWMLLTTLAISTFAEVWQYVTWYSYRWLIERFHFTLKSGCRIEELQLRHRDRLLNALATYNIVAWRLMHLSYHARLHPEAPCDAVLEPHEWRLLRRKFEPKNRSKTPPTLRQAIRWIAQLGGFKARTRDGEPGLKTLWRGLSRFHHLLEGAQLVRQT